MSLYFRVFFEKSIRNTNYMGFKVEAAKTFIEMWREMAKLSHLAFKSNGNFFG